MNQSPASQRICKGNNVCTKAQHKHEETTSMRRLKEMETHDEPTKTQGNY